MPSSFFFFNDTATTEIYTLSLHDALPILRGARQSDPLSAVRALRLGGRARVAAHVRALGPRVRPAERDRKSTRLNSSHSQISYAVFCLKKKNTDGLTSYMAAAAQDGSKVS